MKKLLIISGKGGTGKTTTAAAMIDFSRAKAFADCDVDAPNLHLVERLLIEPQTSRFMGGSKAVIDPLKCTGCGECAKFCRFDAVIKEDGKYRILDYACEGCGVCEYICRKAAAVTLNEDEAGRLELYKGDSIFSTAELKMGRGNSGKLVAAVKTQLFREKPDSEIAIIDGSPGIGCPVMASVSGMDMVLIVTEPTVSGLSDLKRLVESISLLQVKIAVCVNKWDACPEKTEAIRDYCEENDLMFAGTIPYDQHASAAVNEGISLAGIDCPARDALKEIYDRIVLALRKA